MIKDDIPVRIKSDTKHKTTFCKDTFRYRSKYASRGATLTNLFFDIYCRKHPYRSTLLLWILHRTDFLTQTTVNTGIPID